MDEGDKIRRWLLSLHERFHHSFYHIAEIRWQPENIADLSLGRRVGGSFLLRRETFQDDNDVNTYLKSYKKFLRASKDRSFANWVFREVKQKGISIIVRSGSTSKLIERKYNMPLWILNLNCGNDHKTDQAKYSNNQKNADEFNTSKIEPIIMSFDDLEKNEKILDDNAEKRKNGNSQEKLKDILKEIIKQDEEKKLNNLIDGLNDLCIIPVWETILFIPVPVVTHNNAEVCFWGVVVFSLEQWAEIIKNRIEEWGSLITEILSFGNRLTIKKLISLGTNQYIEAALRSGAAAIMSRNMSHNIGSHVLAKMGYTSIAELNLPHSQIFYRYMQQRMDFIAIIATEIPKWSYSTWFFGELIKWFYQQETLLEFIARQEGIKGSFTWSKNKEDQINESTLLIRIRYKGAWIIHEDPETVEKDRVNDDFLLAIPGGLVGYHALYIILEDIIRNSAKHNWANLTEKDKQGKGQLKITIDIENEDKNDYVTFKIYDNISETNSGPDLPDNYSNLKSEEIEKLPLHQKINLSLIKSFIDSTGQLRRENWGLQEMKISAGYLNKNKITEIGDEGKDIFKIIKAVPVEDPDERSKSRLGYEFKLLKPKIVGIIGEIDKATKAKFNCSNAKKHGIYYFEEEPLEYDYEFMILIDDDGNKVLNKILENPDYELEKLPYRLFVVSNNQDNGRFENIKKRVVILDDLKIYMNNNDYEAFKIKLYEHWLNKIRPSNDVLDNINIYINFSGSETQSEKWDLELFKKCEDLIKMFAKAMRKEEENLNQKWEDTLINNDVLNGITDPVDFFFIMYLRLKPEEVDLFKSYFPFFSYNKKLPPIYKEERFQNINCGTNHNAQIKIIRHHLPEECFYGEEISGSCTHYQILSRYTIDPQLHYKILENAFLKMLIIDERMIDFIDKKSDRVKNRFKSSRIVIPVDYVGVKINIDSKSYEYKWAKNSNNILDLDNVEIDINLLIIHQGIIDKMKRGEEKVNPEEFVRKIKEKIQFVIITSGRGEPENVPKNAKFVPFSVIESTLMKDYHEKFILAGILMSLIN